MCTYVLVSIETDSFKFLRSLCVSILSHRVISYLRYIILLDIEKDHESYYRRHLKRFGYSRN